MTYSYRNLWFGVVIPSAVVHMNPHGDDDSVESSKANPVETISWSEIASAVTTDRGTKPLPNIVVSYACETLRNTYPAAEAFKVRNPGAQGMIENRAIAGFNDVIYAGPIAYNYSRTDLHAAKIYDMLKMTHTLEEAIDAADQDHPIMSVPYGSEGEPVTMMIHGDAKATISGVYKS